MFVINFLFPPLVIFVLTSFDRSLTKYLPLILLLLLRHRSLSIRVKRVAFIKSILNVHPIQSHALVHECRTHLSDLHVHAN